MEINSKILEKYVSKQTESLFLAQLHKVISSKPSFVFNQYARVKTYGTKHTDSVFKNLLPLWRGGQILYETSDQPHKQRKNVY